MPRLTATMALALLAAMNASGQDKIYANADRMHATASRRSAGSARIQRATSAASRSAMPTSLGADTFRS